MLVKDLIQTLSSFNPDAEVLVHAPNCCNHAHPIQEVVWSVS